MYTPVGVLRKELTAADVAEIPMDLPEPGARGHRGSNNDIKKVIPNPGRKAGGGKTFGKGKQSN